MTRDTPPLRPIAVAALAVLLLAACAGPRTNESGAVPSAAEPSAPAATATPAPTESAGASPAPSEPPSAGDWTLAATFEEEGTRAQALKLLPWGDGFVAIGERARTQYLGPSGTTRLWRSADGRAWEELTPDLGFEDAGVGSGTLLDDGRLMLFGHTGDIGAGEPFRPRAWASEDLVTWTELDLPFADSTTGYAHAAGPRGHIVTGEETIWFSDDGLEWTAVYDAQGDGLDGPAAGEEGFTVMRGDTNANTVTVLASADGVEWFASEPRRSIGSVGSFGADWLGWEYDSETPTIQLLRSANGLDWEAYQDVNDLTPPDGPKAGEGMASEIQYVNLTSAAGLVVMTFSWNHCCAQLSQGVIILASTDATEWNELDLHENAVVTASAANDEAIVLGGYVNRGQAAAFWVLDR